MKDNELDMNKGRCLTEAESKLLLFDDPPDIPDGLIPILHIKENEEEQLMTWVEFNSRIFISSKKLTAVMDEIDKS